MDLGAGGFVELVVGDDRVSSVGLSDRIQIFEILELVGLFPTLMKIFNF